MDMVWCIKSLLSGKPCYPRQTIIAPEELVKTYSLIKSADVFKTKEEAKRAYIKAEEAHINNLFREWALAVNSLNNFKDTLET